MGRQESTEQQKQRQHSKTFTIDSDGDEDDESSRDEDDDSDDDDRRGNDNTTRREKDVSHPRLRNKQTSLARTSTRRRRSFIITRNRSTNFQSAGSFWSR